MKTGELAGGAKTSRVLLGVLEHILGVTSPHIIRPWQQQQQQQHSNVKHSNTQAELYKTCLMRLV
jgi:hypothetical protein